MNMLAIDSEAERNGMLAWLPVCLGLSVLYLPTLFRLAFGLWREEDYVYGYLILAAVIGLFWSIRTNFFAAPRQPKTLLGGFWLSIGLLIYIVGRSQNVVSLEVVSQIPVLLGVFLLMRGSALVVACWFPLLFMLFLVPPPQMVVDSVTGPLKEWVSHMAESILYRAGYPIARNGVTLVVGQYQLLVADACSGLRSMFSLSAIGVVYIYLLKHRSVARNSIFLLSIIPIAAVANVVRVIALIAITYHFGDAAGQSFLHSGASVMLLIVALLCLFLVDHLLAAIFPLRNMCWQKT